MRGKDCWRTIKKTSIDDEIVEWKKFDVLDLDNK